MSGTSQDGVDVALIDTDGEAIAQFGATACRPYTKAERTLLRRATAAAANLTERTARPEIVAEAEQLINDAHAEAVETFLAANDLKPPMWPRSDSTVRRCCIGRNAGLHCRSATAPHWRRGSAFRSSTIFAPPTLPRAGRGRRWRRSIIARWCIVWAGRPPVAVLNIGGVANVTYIDGEELIACDTGPGNALLDDFLRLRTGRPLDTDGRKAAAGAVDEATIERLLQHPFFAMPPPKSLDRNDFRGFVGDTLDGIGVEDGAATLTALTAAAVARIVPHLPRAPATWIVAGGGARNPTLMRMLAERACARAHRIRARGRLVDRFARSAGLRLSRRAQPARPADHVSRNHRRAAPADRRRAGEAVGSQQKHALAARLLVEQPVSLIGLFELPAIGEQMIDADLAVGDKARAIRLDRCGKSP